MNLQKEVTHTCGLCKHVHKNILYCKWGYPIVKCDKCGFVETVIPAELDLSSIYGADYYDGGRVDGYIDYKSSRPILEREFGDLLNYLETFLPQKGKLVELGCAYGFLLKQAETRYNQVFGFEISVPSIEYCKSAGLEVFPATDLAGVLPNIGPVDVIVMLDTIEHVEKPKELLELLFNNLSQGGLLILTTGDISSVYSRITGKYWRLMTPPQHLSFFSVRTMNQMLKDLGFEVVKSDKPWKKVPLKLILYQILSRLRLKKIGIVEKLPNVGLPVNLFDAMRVVARKS